ncbi:MAG: DUF4258 domain-containing protein [Candidatus Omnitrophica bacterium]|nr:DUF4258 domain-containing protein [Candidatus Omnitrophota bacterium]
MNDELLATIKKFANEGCYRIKIHAVRHMIEEGFSEKDIIAAILGESRIIEMYDEDKRCLILGHFLWDNKTKSPIHVVCDYSNRKLMDIVTAYIPQRPWWISPTQRGRRS